MTRTARFTALPEARCPRCKGLLMSEWTFDSDPPHALICLGCNWMKVSMES